MKKPKVKPRGRAAEKIAAGLCEALAHVTARNLEASARAAGMHQARAELLAPTLKLMEKIAARCGTTDGSDGMGLNPTDCILLLACLSEAGYRPATKAQDTVGKGPLVWTAVTDYACKDADAANDDAKKAA